MTWEEGTKKLRKDPILGPIVKQHGPLSMKLERNYFRKLVSSIISQQISTKAAVAILARVEAHYKKPLSPTKILAQPQETLLALGLSGQKAAYIYDLAHKFADGTITPRKFTKLTDEEIIAELTQVKGIGRWTAEMFLIFALQRDDVWPVDDYGIQKAVQHAYRLADVAKGKKLQPYGEQWKPYRTVASLYLWKSLGSVVIKTKEK